MGHRAGSGSDAYEPGPAASEIIANICLWNK